MSGSQWRRLSLVHHATGTAPYRTVTPVGALDLASIGDLRAELCALVGAGHVRLVVDLSRVGLCDAAAMGELVRAGRCCERRGGWLRLACPAGIVATAFQIVSFGRSIAVYPSMAAAVAGAEEQRILR